MNFRQRDTDQTVVIPIDFMRDSHPLDYNCVPDIDPYKTANVSDLCERKCDGQTANTHFFDHAGASGTGHNRKPDDPHFLRTNSELPLLPFFEGYIGAHGTYRFLSIFEQTAVMVGEPKHGVWRVQENGHIREYRLYGKTGLQDGVDANEENLADFQMKSILNDYKAFIPEAGANGYFNPEQRLHNGFQNYIDLTIYHPKYNGKYDDHVPIDLPHLVCTLTQPHFPYMWEAWKFAVAQPEANKIGPLGMRAGVDIKENFQNVLRLHFLPDANLWANIGSGNRGTDDVDLTLDDINDPVTQTVNYHVVDMTMYNFEIYLVEKTFFNLPVLCIIIVLEHKEKKVFEYIRPDGAYWNQLQSKSHGHPDLSRILTAPNYYPEVHIREKPGSVEWPVYGLSVYGHHHPNRTAFGLQGGACPSRGGDWARYPWGSSGSGWPTNYQEITPMCDGFVIDLKAYANLFEDTWEKPNLGLGNVDTDAHVVEYTVKANIFGEYTDPYLLDTSEENPHKLSLTSDGTMYPVSRPADEMEEVAIPIFFQRLGYAINYNAAPEMGISKSENLQAYCTKSCPAVPVASEPCEMHDKQNGGYEDTLRTTYEIAKKIFGVALILI